jgi:hypothetical protein
MTRAFRLADGFIVVAVLCVGLLGCGGAGSKIVTVSGTVNYAGKPVQEGTITFTPAGSTARSASCVEGEIRYGRYRVFVVPGKNVVFVKSATSAAGLFREHVLPKPSFAPSFGNKVRGRHDRRGVDLDLLSDVLLEQLLSNLVDLSILGDGDSRDQHDEPRQNQRNAAIDHSGLHSSDQVVRNRRLSLGGLTLVLQCNAAVAPFGGEPFGPGNSTETHDQ